MVIDLLFNAEHTVVGLTGKVVVYGSNVDVYCCVQTLLQTGLRGKQIVIVEPPPPSEVTCQLILILTQNVIEGIIKRYWSSSFVLNSLI